MNILLADDNTMLRNLLEEFIKGLKHQVFAAEDGQQALDIFQSAEHQVDLLITDIMMPGINGIELARKIRDHNSQLPIIIISGYAQPDTIAQAASLNATMYEKPIDLRTLREQIQSL